MNTATYQIHSLVCLAVVSLKNRVGLSNLFITGLRKATSRSIAWIVVLIFSGLALPAHAATLSFGGNFVNDNDLWIKHFTLAQATEITAQTWSFGGGFNANGTFILSGGFDPVLALFEDGGDQLLLGISQGGADPAGPGANASSGYVWDAYLKMQLNPGSYRLVLSQDDNTPIGPMWSNGYLRIGDGQFRIDDPHFTRQNTSPYDPNATFVLTDGSQRDSHWEVDLRPFDVPEPSSLSLLFAGLACFCAARVLRNHRQPIAPMLKTRANAR